MLFLIYKKGKKNFNVKVTGFLHKTFCGDVTIKTGEERGEKAIDKKKKRGPLYSCLSSFDNWERKILLVAKKKHPISGPSRAK